MLFKAATLKKIADGTITLAFRRWKRPTVKSGGTLLTSVGQLEIVSVEPATIKSISEHDANRAGFDSRQDLLKELSTREGELTRIEFRLAGADPRIQLREVSDMTDDELDKIRLRLERLGKTWPVPPVEILRAIKSHPEGTRATDLATSVGMERDPFKIKVRVLKGMGLTESLGTGYRVSARGRRILDVWMRHGS